MLRTIKTAAFPILACLLACCLCACGAHPGTATRSDGAPVPAAVDYSGAEKLGEGNKQFYYSVTFADGTVKTYDIATDESTVGAALEAQGLVEGEQTNYGLYVKTIDGVRADYTLDGAYWAFYVNGEYAMAGIDDTAVEPGSEYAFVYTPADAY